MTSLALPSPSRVVGGLPLDRGVSQDAVTLRNRFREVVDEALASVSLGAAYHRLRADLEDAVEEASVEGWDGYEAKAANPHSFALALRLLEDLGPAADTAEAGVDPDGEIFFEWRPAPFHRFAISVQANGRLTYSGLRAASTFSGTEYYDDGIPAPLLDALRRAVG